MITDEQIMTTLAGWPRTKWHLGDGRVVSLITLDEFESLPIGTELVSISGAIAIKGGPTDIDEDTRGEFMAWGIVE